MRAGLPRRGHLLRGRHAAAVEGLLPRQRRLLHRDDQHRLAGWREQGRSGRRRPPRDHGGAARQEHRRALMLRGWAARAALPEFPWDRLAPYGATARAHPGGIVDLSIGTPVDPTPQVVQDALRAAADAPGYPLTIGTAEVRASLVSWVG